MYQHALKTLAKSFVLMRILQYLPHRKFLQMQALNSKTYKILMPGFDYETLLKLLPILSKANYY